MVSQRQVDEEIVDKARVFVRHIRPVAQTVTLDENGRGVEAMELVHRVPRK